MKMLIIKFEKKAKRHITIRPGTRERIKYKVAHLKSSLRRNDQDARTGRRGSHIYLVSIPNHVLDISTMIINPGTP